MSSTSPPTSFIPPANKEPMTADEARRLRRLLLSPDFCTIAGKLETSWRNTVGWLICAVEVAGGIVGEDRR